MDKRLIHAVAGSGKTRMIIGNLNENERTAIITYTVANQEELKKRIINKFGYMPENIHVFGLFQFLFSFCIRPTGLFPNINGIGNPEQFGLNYLFGNYTYRKYFLNNKLSKYLIENKDKSKYIDRIEQFFDSIYIDEVQDLTSYDFDFILSLVETNINLVYFGDFHQKSFSSSNNGNKGRAIHSSFENWINEFVNSGFNIDTHSLIKSYRCPKIITNFINDNLGIRIDSYKEVNCEVREIIDLDEINKIMDDDSIVKLFYKTHYNYNCKSQNWGDSKGLEFKNICVVLNPTSYKLF